jgi:hypothetical protein
MRNVNDPLPPAKKILALDLGKFKSVACVLDVASNIHRFETINTSPSAVHDLLAEVMPDRLVIEACSTRRAFRCRTRRERGRRWRSPNCRSWPGCLVNAANWNCGVDSCASSCGVWNRSMNR